MPKKTEPEPPLETGNQVGLYFVSRSSDSTPDNQDHTITDDCSIFTDPYILILSYSYWLCVAYISSLHKPYSRFSRTKYITSVNHMYRVCRTYMPFVQLAPQTPSRVAPKMTIQAVPARPGDPPGMNHGASPCTISKNSTTRYDSAKLAT
jgi:hypothetical protein